jgi:hypothetical protein
MSKTGLDPPTLVQKKSLFSGCSILSNSCPVFGGLRRSVTENIMLFFILHDKFLYKLLRGERGVL